MEGSGLYKHELIDMLNESYSREPKDLQNWIIDEELSSLKTKVYKNIYNNDIVVASRGTYDFEDVGTDLKYLIGMKDKRFDEYDRLIEEVKDKYHNPYIIAIGHSLGGLVASSNQNVDEIISYNKPQFIQNLLDEPITEQLDIRSSNDIISILNKFDKNENDINIPSDSNVLDAHSIDELLNLDKDFVGVERK
jgi:hypothetical protein